MNAHLLHIGVIDKHNRVHAVSFRKGVNVITGRSSTGKSALIEIFDYCFGSSDYTIPVGVITECAKLYFTVINISDSALIVGRSPKSSKAFLKEELNIENVRDADMLSIDYFEKEFFIPLRDFLKELKRHFGLNVTDVETDLSARGWRGSKTPTPSARSFTSYMLQHQNLVANKHAIFYRFDQKEKRDQAIDHLKIFLGFVDQEYFAKSQELNTLQQKLRMIERAMPRRTEVIEAAKKKLSDARREYEAISGKALSFDINRAITSPKATLKELRSSKVEVLTESDAHVRLMREAEDERRKLIARLRIKQQEMSAIESSIEFSKQYTKQGSETVVPESAELYASVCPFCMSQYDDVEQQANELTEAINWLNSELSRSSYRLDSYEEEKAKIQADINLLKSELERNSQHIKAIEQQVKDIENVRNQYELSVEVKIRVESILSEVANLKDGQPDQEVDNLRGKIKELRTHLASNYNINQKLSIAETRIQELLKMYGERFDFEKSYTPIQLRFSLQNFDLWHETKDGKQVYLRSMGSGANWLSCHLALFLALHRYFCELGPRCKIPSVLFFDQPSQVYFPSVLDGGYEFSAKEIAEKDSSRDKSRTVDEDIRAVTNIFTQLVKYCKETEENTDIMPQIIITDHADNLELPGDVSFESLVRKRWRKNGDGFINLTKKDQIDP